MTATTTTRRSSLADLLAPREVDSAARRHLVASLLFLLVSGLATLLLFVKLPYPSFFADQPALSYGRLRPIAMWTTVFGWLTLAHLGAIYYLVPRLTGTRLWNERLANLGLWLAVGVNVAAVVLLAAGFTEGREWAELPWWLDLAGLAVLGIPTLIVTRTVLDRREEGLYVSLWYAVAGLYWLVALYVLGNIPYLYGAAAQIQSSFLVSGVTHLWLIGIGIGTAYYLVPKITGNPLYSRQLALIGFWSLAFAGAWLGQSRHPYGPGPDWLDGVAVVLALALVVAALAVVANLAGTMQGKWMALRDSAALRFVSAAMVVLLLVAVVGTLQGLPSVAALIGLTAFGDGTLVLAVYGLATLLAAAFIYHAFPRLFGRTLFSERLSRLHLRLTIVGIGSLVALLWLSGLVSGYGWAGGSLSGAFAATGEGFGSVLDQVRVLYILAAPATAVLVAGQIVFVYNLFRTFTSGAAAPHEILTMGEDDE